MSLLPPDRAARIASHRVTRIVGDVHSELLRTGRGLSGPEVRSLREQLEPDLTDALENLNLKPSDRETPS